MGARAQAYLDRVPSYQRRRTMGGVAYLVLTWLEEQPDGVVVGIDDALAEVLRRGWVPDKRGGFLPGRPRRSVQGSLINLAADRWLVRVEPGRYRLAPL